MGIRSRRTKRRRKKKSVGALSPDVKLHFSVLLLLVCERDGETESILSRLVCHERSGVRRRRRRRGKRNYDDEE